MSNLGHYTHFTPIYLTVSKKNKLWILKYDIAKVHILDKQDSRIMATRTGDIVSGT